MWTIWDISIDVSVLQLHVDTHRQVYLTPTLPLAPFLTLTPALTLTLTPTLTVPSPLALALTHRQWMLVSLMLPVYRAGGAMVLMTSLLTP